MDEILRLSASAISIMVFVGGGGAVIWQSRITARKVEELDRTVHNGLAADAREAKTMAAQVADGIDELRQDIKENNKAVAEITTTLAVLQSRVSLRGCANYKKQD